MPKVLIAAATDVFADLDQTVLGSDSLECVFAPTASAALEVARAYVPTLVVIDGSDASGACAFIRRLRDCPGTRRASILAVSRVASDAEEDLLRAGANLVLAGPMDRASWDEQIEHLLSVPRRLRIRFDVRVTDQAASRADGAHAAAVALDVSLAGMLLETPSPLEVGTILDLQFALPGQKRQIHAAARVVRGSEHASGQVGVRFLALPAETQEHIRRLLGSAVSEQAFGRYEVLDLLGEGSMGKVYRAFDPLARRVVAIKTPKTESLTGPEAEEYLNRFRREAQAAARLVHPNIVTVFDVGEDFFAMELVEGSTLDVVLHDHGVLSAEEACRILRPVATALDHAHAAGIVHRDIKPANLIVPSDGQTKVMDFGVAHIPSAVITNAGQAFGSPAYMAPEQIVTGVVTPQSDVFALGVVAYEALVGRKPFDGETVASILYHVVNTEPQPPSAANPALPGHYDDIFRKALAKTASARFASAGALLDALEGREASNPPAPVLTRTSADLPASWSGSHSETIALRDLPQPTPKPALGSGRWMLGAVAVILLLVTSAPRSSSVPGLAVLPPAAPALQITTEPGGALVLLDGRPAGNAPLALTGVAAGNHTVRVDLKDFAPAELRLEVSSADPLVPLRFVLQPLLPTVEIDSDPTSAAVQVDGVTAGATPLSAVPLRPGPHEVRIERAGFQPWSQTIEIAAGTNRAIEAHLRPIDTRRKKSLRDRGWTQRGDRVDVGPGVSAPERITGAAPAYPEQARPYQIAGSVTVELIVDETGVVLSPTVVESAGDILDEAMLAAVRTWRYRPAENNGVQVRVRIRERYTFDPLR
jgi:eukaryotic-like serine/threonine-protein kinase